MIRFFRKIRQNLFRKNNFRSYFLYAIGEIILVMIGILLALQVNNWNESHKKQGRKDEVLLQVADDLRRNLGDLQNDFDMHNQGLKSNLKVSEYIEKDLPYDPELAFDFWYLNRDEFTTPSTTGYENLKSLGLSSIKNGEMQSILKAIYESLYPRVSKEFELYPDIGLYFSEYYLTHFTPLTDSLLTHDLIVAMDTISFPASYDYDDLKFKRHIGYVPLDFNALKGDAQFKMMLRESLGFRMYKLSRYRNLIQLTDRVLGLIEEEVQEDSTE